MLDEKEKGRCLEDSSPKNIDNQHPVTIANIPTKASANLPIVPDIGMAARFLSMLDPDAKSFAFQVFHDKNKQHKKTEVISGALDEVWERLAAYNKMGYGIFVTVNKTDGTGRKKENIVRVRALWRELDKSLLATNQASANRLKTRRRPANATSFTSAATM